VAVCMWHSFASGGSDVFGSGTFDRPWLASGLDPLASLTLQAGRRVRVLREAGRAVLHVPRTATSPRGPDLAQSGRNLDKMVDYALRHMERTGVRLLMGHGQSLQPPALRRRGGNELGSGGIRLRRRQVKLALESTRKLDGANYVLWGGREGYDTLLKHGPGSRGGAQAGPLPDPRRRAQAPDRIQGSAPHRAQAARATKHQYDHDSAVVHGFLARHDLDGEYPPQHRGNHATLAGHSFHHEIAYAIASGMFGERRRQPRRLPERLGHGPVPQLRRRGRAGVVRDPPGRRPDHGRIQLRRKTPPPEPGPQRPVLRPYRWHRHPGPGFARRRGNGRARSHRPAARRALRRLDRRTRQVDPVGGATLTDLERRVALGNIDPKPVSGRQELLENMVNQEIWATTSRERAKATRAG